MSEETIKKYALHDKKFGAEIIKPILEAQEKSDKAMLSAEALMSSGAERFGAEWTEFLKWAEREEVSNKLTSFIGYAYDAQFMPNGTAYKKITVGASEEPLYKVSAKKLGKTNPVGAIYTAFSGLRQRWEALLEFRSYEKRAADYTKKAEKRIVELSAAGMAASDVATTLVEELGPVPEAPRLGKSDPTPTNTPLKIFQKAFAAVLRAITDTPEGIAESLLKSFGLSDEGTATFRKSVLASQTGHPAMRAVLANFAAGWIENHQATVIDGFVKAGLVVRVRESEAPELVAAGPKAPVAPRGRRRGGKKAA